MVTTNALAASLQTSPASVTDMARKLKQKNLAVYEKYQGIRLTGSGQKIALDILRRHRLWECFLVEKLEFSWEAVHEIAEELEHVGNNELIERLNNYLGHPEVDPHGDPIPDANGKIKQTALHTLSQQTVNKQVEVTGVGDQSYQLLEFLNQKGIKLGTKLMVLSKYDYDQSMEIRIDNQQELLISEQVAKNIYVKAYGK